MLFWHFMFRFIYIRTKKFDKSFGLRINFPLSFFNPLPVLPLCYIFCKYLMDLTNHTLNTDFIIFCSDIFGKQISMQAANSFINIFVIMRQIAEDKIRKAFNSKTIIEFIALFFLSLSPYPMLKQSKTSYYFSSDFATSPNNVTALNFVHPRVQSIMKGYDVEYYFFRNIQSPQPRYTIPLNVTNTYNGQSQKITNEDVTVDFYGKSFISFSFLNQSFPQFHRNTYTYLEFYGLNSGLSSFLIKIIPESNPLILYLYFQRIVNTIICIIFFYFSIRYCLSPKTKENDVVIACILGFAVLHQCLDLFITVYEDNPLVIYYSILKCLIHGGALFYGVYVIKKRLVPAFYPECSMAQIYFYSFSIYAIYLISEICINTKNEKYTFSTTLLLTFICSIPTVLSVAQIYDLMNTSNPESLHEVIQVNFQLTLTCIYLIISSVVNYNFPNSNLYSVVDMWVTSFFCGYIFYQRLLRDDERPLVGLISTAAPESRKKHHKHRESSFESFALSSDDHKKKRRKHKGETSADANVASDQNNLSTVSEADSLLLLPDDQNSPQNLL